MNGWPTTWRDWFDALAWRFREYLPTSPAEWVACVAVFALFGALCWEVTHATELRAFAFSALELIGV